MRLVVVREGYGGANDAMTHVALARAWDWDIWYYRNPPLTVEEAPGLVHAGYNAVTDILGMFAAAAAGAQQEGAAPFELAYEPAELGYWWTRVLCEGHPRTYPVVWQNLPGIDTTEHTVPILHHAAGFLARSSMACELLRWYGVESARIHLCHAAVDCARFCPRAVPRRPDDGRVRVLFAGRSVPEKGLFDLAAALISLPPELRERVTLVLAGGATLNAGPVQVEPLGPVPHHQMPAVYQGCDLFVYPTWPTAGWLEQWGLAVVEAMACFPASTPVIAQGIMHGAQRRYTGSLVRIETSGGPVQATHDHPFWTSSGWRYAYQIQVGDGLLQYTHASEGLLSPLPRRIGDVVQSVSDASRARDRRDNGPQGSYHSPYAVPLQDGTAASRTSAAAPLSSIGAGTGLCGGSDRWRGHGQDEAASPPVEAVRPHCQHGHAPHGLACVSLASAVHQDRDETTGSRQSRPGLYIPHRGHIASPSLRGIVSLLGHQAAPYAATDRVLPLQDGAGKGYPPYPAPDTARLRVEATQYSTVKAVDFLPVTDLPVYNLTTQSGLYWAAGYLVHNCGLPVVTTDVGAFRELLPPALRATWTIPARDWVGLRDLLAALVANRSLRETLGVICRTWTVERFDGRETARQYRKALEGGG